jgi:hypothetical protein
MKPLNILQKEWLKKFEKMSEGVTDLTGPFLSIPPRNYDPSRVPSVLYIGKANAGWECYSTVKQLRQHTARFLKNGIIGGDYQSAFWRFALSLSDTVRGGYQTAPLNNLIWTNICKVGVKKGNPSTKIFEMQRALGILTLRAELSEYRPRLVVWVTGDYGADVIGETIGDPEHALWNRSLEKKGFWWRNRSEDAPAMLWTYHPQGKTRETVNSWLEKARDLFDT